VKVAVTGAFGMLGFHTRAFLATMPGAEVVPLGRGDLDDADMLSERIKGCDLIFHLAGVNRSDSEAVRHANAALARQVAEAVRTGGTRPHIVFSNSVHRVRDDAYGAGKREAAEILTNLQDVGVTVSNVVLPHVFGEFGRPNYNSVVHTFASEILKGATPEINPEGQLQLLHASRAADLMWDAATKRTHGDVAAPSHPMSVGELYDTMVELHEQCRGARLADHGQVIRLDLLNTLRSYYYPNWVPGSLTVHQDERGGFYEAIKVPSGGQTSVSTTAPGVTRGQHWHRRKLERFVVLRGTARIQLRKLFDDAVVDIDVSGEVPTAVDMPTMVVHNITNTGDGELVTLFWTNDLFDPANPDTFPEVV
jgi:UDP-2-acetamido-2,6-beta-L-arabino-hexul-4-ose reductase